MSGNTPPWPSLYNPGLEILHIDHRNATQAGGAYLYHAKGSHSILSFVHHWFSLQRSRYISVYAFLDAPLLHSHIPCLRFLCILEPQLSTLSTLLCTRQRHHPKCIVPTLPYSVRHSPSSIEAKGEGTTFPACLCAVSSLNVFDPERCWCCCGFGGTGVHSNGVVQGR